VNRFFRSALFPLIVIVLLVYLASQTLIPKSKSAHKVVLSDVYAQIQQGQVKSAVFSPSKQSITLETTSGQKETVHYASDQAQLQIQNLLREHGVSFDSKGTGSSPWWGILAQLLPFVLLFGFWIFLMNQVQGGGSKVMSFGKSRAKRMAPDSPKIGFKDVAGVDEAVEELQEIKEFLENPKKFQALGARIPKGVLLYGPPGTGKTLLAPTSSRCSSALAPRASAISSSRRSRPRRALCSWTRSTPSAVTAAPGSAAAMTSASRRSTSCSSRWTASS
jgi:cell division protease FtsH